MSQSGCRYYILYFDDYSRLSWVFFLRSKTSAKICEVSRKFKTMTELQFSTRIARFRCDNGKGEYDNEEFRSILKESGISFEPAPPYSQHWNGVAERMIQTHNAKAHAMMLDSQLQRSLWAEAINTANYLHAQSPTSANKGVLHSKYYGSDIRIRTVQEGIGNSSSGLRMAYRDRATDSVGTRLGSTDSAAPGNPWAKYRHRLRKRKHCHRGRQPWWSS